MSSEGNPALSFIVMEYHPVILDRTFVVTVTAAEICGARVQGSLALGWDPGPEWRDIDMDSEAYIRLDRANFQIPLTQVERVRFNSAPKWGKAAVSHSGKICLELNSGVTREFVLLGSQDGRLICERLREAVMRARAS